MRRRCNAGVAQVEFLLAAALVLVPLSAVTLQLMLLTSTRQILEVAAVLTTRAGSVAQARPDAMRTALAEALQPLYPGANNDVAFTAAIAEFQAGNRVELRVLPPSMRMANGARQRSLDREIPNEAATDDLASAASALRFLDANLLQLELRYCAPLQVPFAAQALLAARAGLQANEAGGDFDRRCVASEGWPLLVRAVQVMQSPRLM